MNIEHLREFVTLGKEMNFTQGARKLHLAQSTLSRHVSAVEREVGAALVRRTTTVVELTPEGKVFLEEAIAVVDRYEQALETTRESKARQTPLVRVGGHFRSRKLATLVSATTSIAARRHLPIMIELYTPHSSASLAEMSNHEAFEVLMGGLVDAAFLVACDERDWSDLEYETLFHEPFVIYAEEGHPLTRASGPLSLADLRNETFTVSTAYLNHTYRFIDICRQSGFKPRMRNRIFDTWSEMMVARGDGDLLVTAASDTVAVSPTSISGLVQLSFSDPNAYYQVLIAHRKDCQNPGLSAFMDVVRDANRALESATPDAAE